MANFIGYLAIGVFGLIVVVLLLMLFIADKGEDE
jgi:hypothetical protein